MFNDPEFGLDQAQALFSQAWTVTRDPDMLAVRWKDGPTLRIRLARGRNVRNQIAVLARDTPYAAMLGTYDAWFEIRFDDLDEVLDEINTLIEVQANLSEATQGYVYRSWNGSWSEPDE